MPVVSRVDGGVARQQQLDDFNAIMNGSLVQGCGIATGKGNQDRKYQRHNSTENQNSRIALKSKM
jgi:hypothetical protein